MASKGTERDHFHVLVFCALESELQAARRVLENGTDSVFNSAHTDIVAGLLVCPLWNKTQLTVALISQPDIGGTACNTRLTELQKHFSVSFAVMTGVCAGEADVNRGIEYGTVVIAKCTVMEEGIEMAGGDFLAQGNPEKLDSGLISVIESTKGNIGRSASDWMDTIPHDARRPSPRYAQELILDEVVKSDTGLLKRDLLGKLRSREGTCGQMDTRSWGAVLKSAEAAGWVSVTAGVVKHAEQGIAYKDEAFEFPREDEISIVVGSIGTIRCETENLSSAIGEYRKRMANGKLKGIEMEAHHFMTQCKAAFSGCLPLVMKGISDYGDPSRQDYYLEYAASTPVALLRYLLTQKPFYEL